MPLHLEIVTPERRAFVGEVDEVIAELLQEHVQLKKAVGEP